jgi:molybdopterin-biosynthesis enzyme MoeA-like protein
MIKKAYENAYERGILKLEGMTKEREKMAYLPVGSTPLKNLRGTAPGVKLIEENTIIFCLPGVPMEMKGMFNSSVVNILKERKGKFVEKGFVFSGIGESQIAAYTGEMEKKYPEIWIKTHPRLGEFLSEIEVSITALNVENGEELVEKALNEVRNIVLKLKGEIKD